MLLMALALAVVAWAAVVVVVVAVCANAARGDRALRAAHDVGAADRLRLLG